MSSRRLRDGTVLNANLRLTQAPNNTSKYQNFGLYKAQILELIPKGDPRNKWKKGVEYRAVLVGGKRDGEELHGLVPLCGIGGEANFNEVVYKPRTKTLRGKNKGDKTAPDATDGSYVVVSFLNGHYNFPIIMSGWAQPNNTDYGATAEDDLRILGRYQGLRWNIDKSGKLTIDHSGTSIVLDGPEGDVTVTTTQKTVVNATDNVEVNSSSEVRVASTGKTQVDAGGDVDVTAAGEANISGANGITFFGPFTKIGSSGASEHVILGDLFKIFFDAHVHLDPQGGVTGPPTVDMPAYTLSTKATVE